MAIPESDRREAARQLVVALEDPGFLYLQNVKGYQPDELFQHTKWFFSLSTEVRMSLARNTWNPSNTNHYRGYYPTVPGMTCHKEAIEFTEELPGDDPDILSDNYAYEPNMWPPENLPGALEFRKYSMSYYQSMCELGLEIVHLLAIGLKKEEHYFDKIFLHKPMSTLRYMHYPVRQEPVPETAKKDGLVLTCLEHTDTVFATFLSTFNNKGLQILRNGSWVDVDVRPECLVMNAGDALVKATGRFKATRHRVIDHGKERYSVPFFLEPGYYSEIGQYARENQPQNVEVVAKCSEDEPMQYGPWLARRMEAKNYSDYPTETKM
jgi:isopenicillin N synthase-like dioxygenase